MPSHSPRSPSPSQRGPDPAPEPRPRTTMVTWFGELAALFETRGAVTARMWHEYVRGPDGLSRDSSDRHWERVKIALIKHGVPHEDVPVPVRSLEFAPGARAIAMKCTRAEVDRFAERVKPCTDTGAARVKARVLLADPAWDYRNFTDSAHGAADAAYDTMSTAAICALPVGSWAAKDAVLFLWGTWPKLQDALSVMDAWGFVYTSAFPWVKTVPDSRAIFRGIGFWTMATSEFCLIGKRGEPKRKRAKPVMGLAIDGEGEDRVLYAPRSEHSRKPETVHEWIERIFPEESAETRLELFARRARPGWTTWGRDTGFNLTPQGAIPCSPPPETPLPLFSVQWATA